MRRLNIYTTKYEQELRDFAAKAAAAGQIAIGCSRYCEKRRLYRLECTCTDSKALPETLAGLLMDVAEAENAVYKCSPKLRALANGMRSAAIREGEAKRMRIFLTENKALHLEGYATFRMTEYREKLDMMAYSLVKKIKFGKRD